LRVVVTGAGGYVGGRLVEHLRGDGVDVVPLVRQDTPWLAGARAIDDLLAGDLAPLLAGADAVVHLAAPPAQRFRTGAERIDADPAYVDTVAVAERVASAARSAGVPRLVHLSTFHVYGDAARGLIDEDVTPAPTGGYGASRAAAEQVVVEHGPEHTVRFRLTNALGPAADRRIVPPLVAQRFCQAVVDGEDLEPQDGGRALRDFVDMGEACRVIAAAAAGEVAAGTYNLGSGETRRIRDLADEVADAAEEVLGRRPAVAPQPETGDPPIDFRVSVARLAAHVTPPSPDLRPALADTIRLLSRTGAGDA
jgi:nucleoside-diphosphate-sugar epimerase